MIVLVAALLVAVLGAVLVFLYAQSTVESARAELDPVSVLVASDDVPEGTTVAQAVTDGSLELTARPFDALPPGYLEGIEDVGELVTSTDILPGEVLVRGRLVDPAASDELEIGPQQMAITIPLEDPNRVARFVEPGALVAVFLTRQAATTDAEGVTGPGVATTQLLLPEVRVVGVGSRTAPDAQPGDDVSQALVTVSVLQADAERLILGQSLGSLYLGLLTEGTDESAVTRSDGTTAGSLFQGAP
ncbi:Flp pilus assembly protein CpaB [Aquipuribacter sp. MA13-6]|uniref:Flp pilus assembly protein CpaB n=1 Tax=unclassified Aquipuribacter TaxID=2635084 RepID=UPI003EE93F9A